MGRVEWLAERVREFGDLRGRRVEAWTGVEMALREDVGGRPQFEDPSVPFLQLLSLSARFADGSSLDVGTYQDDNAWGLWPRPASGRDRARWEGIFRWRELPELPTGAIDDVVVTEDEDQLAEVLLRVRGRPLLMLAGEVYEQMDGRLTFARLDESVLVFTDPAAADSVVWGTARRSPPPAG
ncbi:hypothetical protein [Actinoplanes sp. NPDC051494]|uniref:hypothetical protein n=1 Tax=Actinoplanes sp. NPDC051494 TaxID=3363907 RepID=UPI0037BA7F89